jgi:hypothetical protein
MSTEQVLQRLRTFLLALAALLCVGTLVELSLINHLESPIQVLPFILALAAIVVAVWVLLRPTWLSLWVLRVVMAITLLGSAFGVFEHIEHNLAFELEIRPNAVATDVLLDALGGANPLLAPGVLGIAALIALATYYHPKLRREPE